LLVVERFGHRRGHEAGRDAVHSDAAACEFLRDGLGHPDQRRLRRHIIRLSRIASHSDDRGYGDDPAEPRLHHRLGRSAHQPERGLEVDPNDLLELLVLHPHEKVVAGHSGIVDEDVELAAQRLDRRRHKLVNRRSIGKIAADRDMIAAQFLAESLQLLDIAP